MGNLDPLFFPLPPRFWFRKGSTQGSYFEAISGVFPYPNGSCKKIGFHIELQIFAIGIGWFLLALPPKNRTCEFPRIRLKWRRFEDARPKQATAFEPLSEKALVKRASALDLEVLLLGERNESFALGKRFAVAKLTASLSPRAKLRPRLLVTSGRLFPSPEIQVSTGKDLLIPRGRLGSKLPVAYLTPFLIISKIGCPFPLSLRRR